MVLQSIWQVRVDGNHAILGVPQGWFDENHWFFDRYLSKEVPVASGASLRGWLLGAASTTALPAADDGDDSRFGGSHRSVFIFSRSGAPVALAIWLVPRYLLVMVCSGLTLFLGFLAIFTRARLRTIWLGLALVGLLAGTFLEPNVLYLVVQSAAIGLALTLLGLVIRTVIERSRGVRHPPRDSALVPVRPSTDSSLDRSASAARTIRRPYTWRVPSTLDFVATPAAETPVSD